MTKKRERRERREGRGGSEGGRRRGKRRETLARENWFKALKISF